MEPGEPQTVRAGSGRLAVGLSIVAIGVAFLLNTLGIDVPWAVVVPSGLVLVGVVLIINPRSGSAGAWMVAGAIITVVLVLSNVFAEPFGFGEPDNVERADFVVTDPVERVVLTVDTGRVEILEALAGSGVAVEVERLLSFGDERPRVEHSLTDGLLEIEADCPGTFFSIGGSCSVDHVVRVRASVEVQIDSGSGTVRVSGLDSAVMAETGSGSIELVDLSGRITAATGSGGIGLERVSGPADVSTGSGTIRGTDLTSPRITAQTGSGSINLDFAAPPEALELETGSGSITAMVPAGSYRLDLNTNSGSTTASGITEDASSRRTIRARTGSGSIRITGTE